MTTLSTKLLLSVSIASLCSFALGCGGKTEVNATLPTISASGGANATGASGGTGNVDTIDGTAGCAERAVVYPEDSVFPQQNKGINNLPECIPTCGQNLNTVQAMPAGPCTDTSSCVVMMLPTSGVWHYFLCACVSQNWSCAAVSGAP